MYLSVIVIIPAPAESKILFDKSKLVRLFPSQKNCPLVPYIKVFKALSVADVFVSFKISFNSLTTFFFSGTDGS